MHATPAANASDTAKAIREFAKSLRHPAATADTLDHTPLTFGKYQGRTPDHVAEEDPAYIVWMYDNLRHARNTCSQLLADACRPECREYDNQPNPEYEH